MRYKQIKYLVGFLWTVIIIVNLFTCSGCASINKAIEDKRIHKALAKMDQHPDSFAHSCAVHFPIKDSLGKIIIDSIHSGDNIDYGPLVDSLANIIDSMQAQDRNEHPLPADYESACWIKNTELMSKITTLSLYINSLKAKYKPCKPDTVFERQPVYMLDGAAVVDANVKADNAERALKKAQDDLQAAKAWKTRAWITWLILLIILAAWLFYQFGKSKIPITIK